MFNFWNLFKQNKKQNVKETNQPTKNVIELMYLIDRPQPTEFFVNVRRMAGYSLQREMDKLKEDKWYKGAHWIKAEWTYPCFEHLTFAYKNQIFCVLIDIIDEITGKSVLPDKDKNNLIENCTKNNLIPCLYKVTVKDIHNPIYNTIKPISDGWNLYNAITDNVIIPEDIVSHNKVELSEWELNDFAIQIVRNYIQENLHFKVQSYQNIVGIEPQIWFEDDKKNLCYVVVRNTAYPNNRAEIPDNINSIQLSVASYEGYFASVAFCAKSGDDLSKLYRGDGVHVAFKGLEKLGKLP